MDSILDQAVEWVTARKLISCLITSFSSLRSCLAASGRYESCANANYASFVIRGSQNGQICSATSRLLLQEKIAEPFIKRLVAAVNKIPICTAPLSPDFKQVICSL